VQENGAVQNAKVKLLSIKKENRKMIGKMLYGVITLTLASMYFPVSMADSRYALCLSGGIRTFTYTLSRYIQFIETNSRAGGVDVFLYVYDDSNGVKSATLKNGIPESVSVEVRQFLGRPEVKKYEFEVENVFPKIKRDLRIGCSNMDRNRMLSCLMQANKLLMCQNLLNSYVKQHRRGEEYSLIVRSRPDILFPPQPLELSKFDDVVRADRERLVDDVDGLFRRSFSKQLLPKFSGEARSIARYNRLQIGGGGGGDYKSQTSIEEGEENKIHHSMNEEGEDEHLDEEEDDINYKETPRFLFVPMCGDWNGINDQFAIGTSEAMNDYAQRLYTWKFDHPIMKACVCVYGCPFSFLLFDFVFLGPILLLLLLYFCLKCILYM
jgi:hypothetical protein